MVFIHIILLVVLDIRKQAFDLKSVSIKRIVCSVDYGGWLTDCIQPGARSLYFETGQLAETGHCGDKWNRSWFTYSSVTELTVEWHWLSHWLDCILVSLPATGWVVEVEVLWATLKITNETTSVRDRITAIFSVHWTGVLILGHEVEPSQLQCFTILLTTFTSPIVTNCNLIHLIMSSNNTL